jgi:hypothetical protein
VIKEYAVEARMVVRETFTYVMEASKKCFDMKPQ